MSLNSSSVCVVDERGKIVREAKVASEPVALINSFKFLGMNLERIGLEAGPLSQWLYGALRESELPSCGRSRTWRSRSGKSVEPMSGFDC